MTASKKIVALLFALPFAGVGLFMGWSIASQVFDAYQMSNWMPVQAHILKAGYHRHQTDGSGTFEAYVEYKYEYQGSTFLGQRVGLDSSADNIGDYQKQTGLRLKRAQKENQQVTIFVNPHAPAESIFDPNLRWEIIGFKALFLFIFGGVGFGLAFYILIKKAPPKLGATQLAESPWLAKAEWQHNNFKSNSKSAMYFSWFFAALWNLISLPIAFLIYPEVVDEGNYPALLGLMFPMVGIGLLVWANKRSQEWRRFGITPLSLDPFPGAIGGDVGGTIEINLPYQSTHVFCVTLTCLKSYVSGSGKNRRRCESAHWQSTTSAHSTVGRQGTALTFRFEVPDNLPASQANPKTSTYYLWRLSLNAELEGTDLARHFEIPVYPSTAKSQHLNLQAIEQAQNTQANVDTESIRKLVKISHHTQGKSILYPMGRHLKNGLLVSLVGAIFAVAGYYFFMQEQALFIGGVFMFLGSLATLGGFYTLFNSLEVSRLGQEVTSTRRILGVTIKHNKMISDRLQKLQAKKSFSSQSNGEHTIFYAIEAVDELGQTLCLGEGFKGENQAVAAKTFLSTELGLHGGVNQSRNNSAI